MVRRVLEPHVRALAERPDLVGDTEVVVTFLGASESFNDDEVSDMNAEAQPLDDFEPMVPAAPVCLADFVLEDRR